MLDACVKCKLPVLSGKTVVLCSLGCGNLLHRGCCDPAVHIDSKFSPCGHCEGEKNSVADLVGRLRNLQLDLFLQRELFGKLEKRMKAVEEMVRRPAGSTDSPSIPSSTPKPSSQSRGTRNARKQVKRLKKSDDNEEPVPPSNVKETKLGAASSGEEHARETVGDTSSTNASKRDRETADLSSSLQSDGDQIDRRTEVVGGKETALPDEDVHMGDDEETAENADGKDRFIEVKKKKRGFPKKICSGTSSAAAVGLEFQARTPLFHALYVDGLAKKTSDRKSVV